MSKYMDNGIEFKNKGILFKIIFFDLIYVDDSVSRIIREI